MSGNARELYIDLEWGDKHADVLEKFSSCAKVCHPSDPDVAYNTDDELAVWWALNFSRELAEKLSVDFDDLLKHWRAADDG